MGVKGSPPGLLVNLVLRVLMKQLWLELPAQHLPNPKFRREAGLQANHVACADSRHGTPHQLENSGSLPSPSSLMPAKARLTAA